MNDGNHCYVFETTFLLGKRAGALDVTLSGGRFNGRIKFLGKWNKFTGGTYRDGAIAFSGTLDTLMAAFPFEASGFMDDDSVRFDLKSGYGTYHMTGKAVSADAIRDASTKQSFKLRGV